VVISLLYSLSDERRLKATSIENTNYTKLQGNPIIQVEHLRKVYGSVIAVDDLSFEVTQGEIFGMVGPNGAGKTTAVECIEGLRSPVKGTIRVFLRKWSEKKTNARKVHFHPLLCLTGAFRLGHLFRK
jgi:ABC-type branched-subunit amino acid transport system ATPase component